MIRGTISCDAAVSAIVVYVNGERGDIHRPANESTETGSVSRFEITVPGLAMGTNLIRLIITASDDYGRTVLLERTK